MKTLHDLFDTIGTEKVKAIAELDQRNTDDPIAQEAITLLFAAYAMETEQDPKDVSIDANELTELFGKLIITAALYVNVANGHMGVTGRMGLLNNEAQFHFTPAGKKYVEEQLLNVPVINHPANLDEAIDAVNAEYTETDGNRIKTMSEEEFIVASHHNLGQYLRNKWCLWWQPERFHPEWPKEKPAIVTFFNDLGIFHADDMSSIILTSFYRKLTDQPVDLEGQVKHYQEFWKNQGFTDGIPKQ